MNNAFTNFQKAQRTLKLNLLPYLICICCLIQACGHESSPNQSSEMTRALQTLVEKGNAMKYYHWNAERAAFYKTKLAEQGQGQGQNLQLWFTYCQELLNAGDYDACIATIDSILKVDNKPIEDVLNHETVFLIDLLALAHFRKGEIENCQENHSAYSCIFPLDEKAFHSLTQGSEKAIELYTILYEKYPRQKFKWLINLAYMTLGQHPHDVPEDLLIDFPNIDQQNETLPPFVERAIGLGLSENGLSGGVCTEDFNNDGLIDIFMTSYGMSDQVKLFLNSEEGFEDVTAKSGLNGIVSGLNCLHADYNNDGFDDIFVLRGGWLGRAGTHPNSLLKNNGDGTFSDVTHIAGILSFHPTQTASWADVNKDGYLDLFIGNESKGIDNHPCELFINQKDGTFLEQAEQFGLGDITAFVKGVSFGDINNDQWPDLFISILGGSNMLFRNNNGKFENVTKETGVAKPHFSFPCWFFDVNNDGFQDIFVASYDVKGLNELAGDYAKEIQGLEVVSDKSVIYINNGAGQFTEQSTEYKIDKAMYAMGANFGDIDNDGWLDFYIGTGAPDFSTVIPNRMFRNVEGTSFEEVTFSSRVGHLQKGHGIAFADFDHDGDQDIYAVMGGAFEGDRFTNVYFENATSDNNFVVLDLVGVQSNKSAIGTRLKLELSDQRIVYHTIGTGGSFGANSLEAEIGLGQASSIRRLEIQWPNSEKQSFENLSVNTKYVIVEGKSAIEQLSYERIVYSDDAKHEHHHH